MSVISPWQTLPNHCYLQSQENPSLSKACQEFSIILHYVLSNSPLNLSQDHRPVFHVHQTHLSPNPNSLQPHSAIPNPPISQSNNPPIWRVHVSRKQITKRQSSTAHRWSVHPNPKVIFVAIKSRWQRSAGEAGSRRSRVRSAFRGSGKILIGLNRGGKADKRPRKVRGRSGAGRASRSATFREYRCAIQDDPQPPAIISTLAPSGGLKESVKPTDRMLGRPRLPSVLVGVAATGVATVGPFRFTGRDLEPRFHGHRSLGPRETHPCCVTTPSWRRRGGEGWEEGGDRDGNWSVSVAGVVARSPSTAR